MRSSLSAARAAAAVAAVLLPVLWVPGPAGAATPTVETLAGPGFCQAPTVIDPAPLRVGALAADPDGWSFVDLVDAPGRGVIRAVDGTQVRLITSNEPVQPVADPIKSASAPPAAARLASAGNGSVVVAAGSRLVQIDSFPPSLEAVAGMPPTVSSAAPGASTGDGGPANAARFASARSVAADENRNLYVADQVEASSATFRIRFINRGREPVTLYRGTPSELTVAPGAIQTIAGGATSTPYRDGGPARDAPLQGVPPAIAVSGDRLYIAAYWALPGSTAATASVRVVNLSGAALTAHGVHVAPGSIETVAGAAADGRDDEGITARAAAISYIPGIASDNNGGVLIAEPATNRVRFIDAAGTMSTFAGTSAGRPSLTGGELDRPAHEVPLDRPVDVKVASGRRVLISEEGTGRVLVVDSSGLLHLAGGAGHSTRCVAPGVGTNSEPERPTVGRPFSVAATHDGAIYFVNLGARQVLKIDTNGRTTVVLSVSASCPTRGPCSPSPGPGVRWPAALAATPDGLFVYDVLGARVLFMNLTHMTTRVNGVDILARAIGIVAGNGEPGSDGDGGPAVQAQLGGQVGTDPGGFPEPPSVLTTEGAVGDVAVSSDGTLFIGDAANDRVRQVDPAGAISTIAGAGGPPGTQACCRRPSGLATDGFGNLYVSDMATRQVWLLNRGSLPLQVHGLTIPPGAAAPVAGTGKRGIGGDGVATTSPLYEPTGLLSDGQGNLYIAEYRDETIRRLDASGNITTVAGTGAGGFNGDGLAPRQAALHGPTDVAFDRCGNLLVADSSNDRIRRITLAGPCPALATTPRKGSAPTPLTFIVSGVIGTAACLVLIGVYRRRARTLRARSGRALL